MRTIKKIFSLFLLSCTLIFVSSCVTPTKKYLDPSTFDAYADEVAKLYIEGDEMSINYLFVNPEDFGLEHYEPTLPTPGFYTDEELAEVNKILGKYKQYNIDELNFDQKMTYYVIEDIYQSVNTDITDSEYMGSGYLGSYLGYQAQLPLLLNQYHLRSKLDVDNYFKYLDLVPETFKAYVDYEILKAEHGYGMPNFVITKVINQCKSFLKGIDDVENPHFMITTINNTIDGLDFLTDEEKATYKQINAEKVRGPLAEGYRYVKDNLGQVRDTAINEGGLGNYVKDGENVGKLYYEAMFQDTVGYDLPMMEMSDYVDKKVSKYYAEIMEVYDHLTSSQMNVLSELKFMEGTVEEQLDYYKNNLDRYFPEIELDFNLEVAYVDPAMEDYFSPAAYMTSAIDDHENEFIILNRGSIYVETEDPETGEVTKELDGAYLYTTLAHEAFPGHLYQNVYFKNTDASLLRKMATNSGYKEGWANYMERMAYVYYFEDNPKYGEWADDYFIANMNFSAALYTKIDIGIHYFNWTVDDTYEFMKRYYSVSKSDVRDVYRQLVEVPTNYPMYFFTYMKIMDMREYALEKGLSEKEFHKLFLDCGPVPLQHIENYIKETYK